MAHDRRRHVYAGLGQNKMTGEHLYKCLFCNAETVVDGRVVESAPSRQVLMRSLNTKGSCERIDPKETWLIKGIREKRIKV